MRVRICVWSSCEYGNFVDALLGDAALCDGAPFNITRCMLFLPGKEVSCVFSPSSSSSSSKYIVIFTCDATVVREPQWQRQEYNGILKAISMCVCAKLVLPLELVRAGKIYRRTSQARCELGCVSERRSNSSFALTQ